jgi:hypothetical protein
MNKSQMDTTVLFFMSIVHLQSRRKNSIQKTKIAYNLSKKNKNKPDDAIIAKKKYAKVCPSIIIYCNVHCALCIGAVISSLSLAT